MSSDAGTTSERSIGSVLSRSSVYTTLRSLDAAAAAAAESKTPATTTGPGVAPSNKKLLQFYSQLSTAHHRLSERLDGKNTSARPLSATDVASRIETRSLTLTGGGYNSVITASSSSNKAKNESIQKPNRQRKRQRRKLWRRLMRFAPCSGISSTTSGNQHDNDDSQMTNLHFLLELNAHWNAYISQILSLNTHIGSDDELDNFIGTLNLKVRSLVDEIEWIGARVQIGSNAARQGVLVSQTLRTWRVARLPPSVLDCCGSDAAATSSNNVKSIRLGKTATVPKQPGASLIVLVPFLPLLKQDSDSSKPTTRRFLKVVLEPSQL